MCDPTGSDMRGHARKTFRQLSMVGTRDTALIPTHNHEVRYRENHFVLHNGTRRIAFRYFYNARGETIMLSSLPGMYSLLIHIIDVPVT